jgi:adenylyl-sulfate kinase
MDDLNIVWQQYSIDKKYRATLKTQSPCILWFTGLSGSGKSTIAEALERKLSELSCHTYLLDGDNVRHGLNKDLGFDDVSRIENIRRIGEVSKLFVDAGLIVLSAFISPFLNDRNTVRGLVEPNEFVEIFVDTPLAVCERRDPKGLYKKARDGEIKNFTGIDSCYENPVNPEIRVDTSVFSVDEIVEQIFDYLKKQQLVYTN